MAPTVLRWAARKRFCCLERMDLAMTPAKSE